MTLVCVWGVASVLLTLFYPCSSVIYLSLSRGRRKLRRDLVMVEVLKIILVGDSAVGKTCLVLRWAQEEFREHFLSTIGEATD